MWARDLLKGFCKICLWLTVCLNIFAVIRALYFKLNDILHAIKIIFGLNIIDTNFNNNRFIVLNKYIEIIQIRSSDHLSVECTIDEEVQEAMIPSMLLQPILENSFEHGYSYDSINLKVSLSISTIDKWLIIRIQNNGAPISGKKGDSGMGISNIQERLETLFGDNFDFSFSNLDNGEGVVTKIMVPLILA